MPAWTMSSVKYSRTSYEYEQPLAGSPSIVNWHHFHQDTAPSLSQVNYNKHSQ